ncbi:MAG: molybdenum cofactor guanylyltransferase [Pedobacter sp.]|nr:molybdenum cofactor guanylyltransferase [Pedobacter sp.]
MGRDKGLMPFKGKPLIQYVIEQLMPAVKSIVLVANNQEYKDFGLEVIGDYIKDIGPAGGIYTALRHTDASCNFIVGCDMPFVTTAAVEFIIQSSVQSQITLPVYHQTIEPLFGIYTKECSTKWHELVQQNIVKLNDMITYFKLQKLNMDNNELFSANLFRNINTQHDFANALNK